jgi:hypothetical protein
MPVTAIHPGEPLSEELEALEPGTSHSEAQGTHACLLFARKSQRRPPHSRPQPALFTARAASSSIVRGSHAKRISEKKLEFHRFLLLCNFARVPAGAFLFNLI